MPKSRSLSLHIGVNAVDPKHYAGWKGELKCAEQDAVDMAALARGMGMKHKVLLTKAATRGAVIKAMADASKQLQAGDFFLLTFSGHGGQVLDVSGDEVDVMDETWCLHDAQWIDDEAFGEIGCFAKGVRVLVIGDASPSGSVLRPYMPEPDPPPAGKRARLMPPLVADKVYRQNMKFYDALQKKVRNDATDANGPDVIAWLGCQYNQVALEGKDNGALTEQVLYLWNQGSYLGPYLKFFMHLVSHMPSTQSPLMRTFGDGNSLLMQPAFKP